jgi:NAD(P)-dependent dehydrogenase (short-subunit alcohol dehydrogenase family)
VTGLLRDKVVLITGASSGTGAAAARLFGREGARLVIAARRGDRLEELAGELRSDGVAVEAVTADVTSGPDIERAVDTAVSTFGRLDGAFNNAGVTYLGNRPLADVDEADVLRLIDVNLVSVWRCLVAEIRAMRLAGGGSIVNNSSVGGYLAGQGLGPYSATKHGVIGFTRTAAVDHAPDGIRVNALAPGASRSELLDAWIDATPGLDAALEVAAPMKRVADAAEIAEAACWLLSDRASFVTGAVLTVDGGFSVV